MNIRQFKALLKESLIIEATRENKLLVEYINYPQDKFIAKWTKEGKPFEDEIGTNGENWTSWLEQYDPTQKKKYVNWMITKYLKDGIRKLEDIPSRLTPLLDTYERLSRKKKLEPEHKDINRVQTLSDLYHLVNSYKETVEDSELNSRKEIEKSFYENGEAELFYNSPNYKIVIPKTEKASCFFGINTQWCTAATNGSNMFDFYSKKGPLYVILEKKTNKRWQFHFEDHQFMDENDSPIDTIEFFESKPEIKKVFGFDSYRPKKGKYIEKEDEDGGISTYIASSYGDTILEKVIHSFDDEPAVIESDGTKLFWYKNGHFHRDGDKPAIVYPDEKRWWRDGNFHRDGDKPAIIKSDGTQKWYQNGEPHRDGDKPSIIESDGTQIWYKNWKVHRDGDKPAVVQPDGTQKWYKNGNLHREDGPAIIFPDGVEYWYKNGNLHRDDGPAIIKPNGTKYWYKNGELHREDGPALIEPDRWKAGEWQKGWYKNGKRVENHLNEGTTKMTNKDKIPGGLADNKKPSDFDKESLKKGVKVEMEHTSDKRIALEIAMDHLTEDPEYYSKLEKAHLEEEIIAPYNIDFTQMADDSLRESFLTQFGGLVKIILQRMNGGQIPNFKVKGSVDELKAFANVLAGERRYMESYLNKGFTNPATLKDKHKLDKWVTEFEKKTGVKWPLK